MKTPMAFKRFQPPTSWFFEATCPRAAARRASAPAPAGAAPPDVNNINQTKKGETMVKLY